MRSAAVLLCLLFARVASGAEPAPCSTLDGRATVDGPALYFELIGDVASPECLRSEVVERFLEDLSTDVLENWKEPTRWGPLPDIWIDVLVSRSGDLLSAASVVSLPGIEGACAMSAMRSAFPRNGEIPPCLHDRGLRVMFLIPWYTDSPVREESNLDATESVTSFESNELETLEVEDLTPHLEIVPAPAWWEFWKRD